MLARRRGTEQSADAPSTPADGKRPASEMTSDSSTAKKKRKAKPLELRRVDAYSSAQAFLAELKSDITAQVGLAQKVGPQQSKYC